MHPRKREPRLESVFQVTNSGLRSRQRASEPSAHDAPFGVAVLKRRQRCQAAVERVVQDVECVEGVGGRRSQLAVVQSHVAIYRQSRQGEEVERTSTELYLAPIGQYRAWYIVQDSSEHVQVGIRSGAASARFKRRRARRLGESASITSCSTHC